MPSVVKIGINPVNGCDGRIMVGNGVPALTGSPFINLSLGQVMKFYHRIKKWEFTFDLTARHKWEITDSNGDFVEFQYTNEIFNVSYQLNPINTYVPPSLPFESEKDYVCNNFYGWENWNLADMNYVSGDSITYPTLFLTPPNSYGLEFLFGFREESGGGGVFTGRAPNFWPTINGNKGDSFIPYIVPFDAYTDSSETQKIVDNGFFVACPIEIGNQTYTANLTIAVGNGPASSVDDAIPSDRPTTDSPFGTIPAYYADFEITAVSNIKLKAKFWPYDPNDGNGSLYDENTGEAIRSL